MNKTYTVNKGATRRVFKSKDRRKNIIMSEIEEYFVRQDNIRKTTTFNANDLVSITECDCCYNLIYLFKTKSDVTKCDEIWSFDRDEIILGENELSKSVS